jgi:hypothetical protein
MWGFGNVGGVFAALPPRGGTSPPIVQTRFSLAAKYRFYDRDKTAGTRSRQTGHCTA